jgi:hypothetical protein
MMPEYTLAVSCRIKERLNVADVTHGRDGECSQRFVGKGQRTDFTIRTGHRWDSNVEVGRRMWTGLM